MMAVPSAGDGFIHFGDRFIVASVTWVLGNDNKDVILMLRKAA